MRIWQSERLARTHADLLASPRYASTATFFLSEIYGPKDLSRHEEEVRRILPLMSKVLPVAGLETVCDAIELNALSESLDADMVAALGEKGLRARTRPLIWKPIAPLAAAPSASGRSS